MIFKELSRIYLLYDQVKETFLLSLFFCPNKYLIYFKIQQEALEKIHQNTLWFAFVNIGVQICALSWMQEFGCHTRQDPLEYRIYWTVWDWKFWACEYSQWCTAKIFQCSEQLFPPPHLLDWVLKHLAAAPSARPNAAMCHGCLPFPPATIDPLGILVF